MVRVAVWGCGHGELDRVYEAIAELNARAEGGPVELLLCCGDFQAARGLPDLATMACPPKYKAMRTFYKYYSGERVAPVLTIFIGGNHEAANHLQELWYGGWVAPNIFYLGAAGVVNFKGLRIGGLSGIYKRYNFREGYYERPPYDADTERSVFHVREFDVWRLMHLASSGSGATAGRAGEVAVSSSGSTGGGEGSDASASPRAAATGVAASSSGGSGAACSCGPAPGSRLDIFLSHDWPTDVTKHGPVDRLLRAKPAFRAEVAAGDLGSPPSNFLLHALQPRYWFSAHLHVKYAAAIPHNSGAVTRFLALDKCLPGRDYLQVLDIEPQAGRQVTENEQAAGLCYDPEWLAVVAATHTRIPLERRAPAFLPPAFSSGGGPGPVIPLVPPVPPAAVADVAAKLTAAAAAVTAASASSSSSSSSAGFRGSSVASCPLHGAATPSSVTSIARVQAFAATVPPYVPPYPGAEHAPPSPGVPRLPQQGNPQTDALLAALGLPHTGITIGVGQQPPVPSGPLQLHGHRGASRWGPPPPAAAAAAAFSSASLPHFPFLTPAGVMAAMGAGMPPPPPPGYYYPPIGVPPHFPPPAWLVPSQVSSAWGGGAAMLPAEAASSSAVPGAAGSGFGGAQDIDLGEEGGTAAGVGGGEGTAEAVPAAAADPAEIALDDLL